MPLMCGPGAIATTLGMTLLVARNSEFEATSFVAIVGAILGAMAVTYLSLAYADKVLGLIGAMGIDAATRIVGFFVSAMGVGLVFHGVIEALQDYGVLGAH
jgi:multiple antibiotic resistance protein